MMTVLFLLLLLGFSVLVSENVEDDGFVKLMFLLLLVLVFLGAIRGEV